MSSRSRFLLVLTIALVVLLGFSVFLAYQDAGDTAVVDQLATSFWLRAWLPHFFNYLSLAVVVSAVITFSLLVSPYDFGASGRLMPAVHSILAMVVVAGVVNGLWFGVIGPSVEQRLHQISDRSQIAETSLGRSRELESQERYEEALAVLRIYRAVVGTSQELENDLEELAVAAGQKRRQEREAARRGGSSTFARAFEVEGLSVPELIRRAEGALDGGNFYTAHYYASLAADLSDNPREDALRLQAEALNAIEDGIRQRDEQEERSLFQEKLAAYQLMQRGETDPRALVEAYYRFQQLRERAPNDPDVERYAEEVDDRLRGISFFVDEAVDALVFPARQDVVFRNDRSAEFSEIISAGRIIDAPHGTFLYDVEVLRRGEQDVHFSVPYGKRVGDMLVLRAMVRSGEGSAGTQRDGVDEYVVAPRYLQGAPDTDQFGEVIPLQPEVDQLLLVAGGLDTLNTLSIPELIRAPAAYDVAGHVVAPVHAELIYRILRIVGFFVVAFYSISIGWRHRSLYIGRPPILVLFFAPLLLWAAGWVISLVRSITDSVLRALVVTGASEATVLIVSGVMLLGLLLAIASVARQTVEP